MNALWRRFKRRSPPADPPLTYLSQKALLGFLSIEQRKQLARRCPQIRKLHRKLPFHLKIVKFEYIYARNVYEITLKGLTWDPERFTRSSPKIRVNCCNQLEIEADAYDKVLGRFFRYYLEREGAKVEECWLGNPFYFFETLPYLRIEKLRLGASYTGLLPHFFINYRGYNFKEIQFCLNAQFDVEVFKQMEELQVSTDCLLMKFTSETRLAYRELQPSTIARKICFIHNNMSWSVNCELLRNDYDGVFRCGTVFKELSSYDPMIHFAKFDWMDQCRMVYNGEFKYFDDRIGIRVEIPRNRELFASYQPNDSFIGRFTAEVLEKGTTKHYHQLPVDLQKKFRGFEDHINRVRVIPNYDDEYEYRNEMSRWKRIRLRILAKIW